MTNASGTLIKSYQYDAFGVEIDPDPADTNPWRYAGEFFDKETGNYCLRARYYTPTTGRFLNEDSVREIFNKMPNGQEIADPLSLNVYTYCYNNPNMYMDYSGHVPVAVAVYVSAVLTSPDLQMDMQFLDHDMANGDYLAAFFDAVGILVPGGTGFGSAAKGVAKSIWKFFGGKTDDAIRATKAIFGDGKIAMGYKALKSTVKGLGYEVHHLLEKRFAKTLGINADDILSIAIDKDTHKQITKLMREILPYDSLFNKHNFSAQEIWEGTVKVYKELGMTEYLDALKQQIIDVGKSSDITRLGAVVNEKGYMH